MKELIDDFDDFDEFADIFKDNFNEEEKREENESVDALFNDETPTVQKPRCPAGVAALIKAKMGKSEAQLKVGKSYIDVDSTEAKFWLEKAAEQGNEEAIHLLKIL